MGVAPSLKIYINGVLPHKFTFITKIKKLKMPLLTHKNYFTQP